MILHLVAHSRERTLAGALREALLQLEGAFSVVFLAEDRVIVARDPNGVGLSSFAFLRNAKGINVESSCGLITRPSIFTVKTEEYPLTRRIYLYTAGALPQPHARGLLNYALSSDAQRLIARMTRTLEGLTARADAVEPNLRIPIVVITAGVPWWWKEGMPEVWSQSHRDIAAAAPGRELVVAEGSRHHVSVDRPDVVVDAILRIVGRLAN